MRATITLLLTLFLISCSMITPKNTPPTKIYSWPKRQQKLASIEQFFITGKIAFQTVQDAGSATLKWQQNRDAYQVSLYGPLGTNNITINGNNRWVKLATADGQQMQASTPEALIAKELGHPLPLSNLTFWIKGLPVPHIPAAMQFDQYHRIKHLQQGPWSVDYLGYSQSKRIDLPNRIIINSPEIKVKVIIYNWERIT